MTFLLTGCDYDLTEDYTKTNKEMLDNFLGEWEVVNERKAEVLYQPWYVSDYKFERWLYNYGPAGHYRKPFYVPTRTFLNWDLSYKDANGEIQEFSMSNLDSIEKTLIYEFLNKIERELNNEFSKEIYTTIEDPYLIMGGLKEEYFTENFNKIEKLYGDKLYLKNANLETTFEGTPIFAIIVFDYKDFKNMNDNEFNEFVNNEIDRLLEKSPYLNASVEIYTKEERIGRNFIQGKELEKPKYTGSNSYKIELKKYFQDYRILEAEKKFLKD